MENDKFKKELIIYATITTVAILSYGGYVYFSNKNLKPVEQAPIITEEIIEKDNKDNKENRNLLVEDFMAPYQGEQISQEVLEEFTAPEKETLPPSKELLKSFSAPSS